MSVESVLWVERQAEPLREKTLKALREAILSDHLKPGQRLVERDLCEQTGVSRSSIREALRYLESEGLVESHGPKGMFVSVLTRQQAMEIYEVRAALEGEAARHFAERASEAAVAELREAFSRVERVALNDPEAYGREIDQFFEVLFTGAGNATAHALMRSLRARINFMRNTTIRIAPKTRVKGSMAQMKRIIDAMERRDGEAAAAACRGYVARSAEFAEQHFSKMAKDAPQGA
ncbi:GntR family transcriptional regulator [Limobrevibacterium gyesilva]|uniref:GntR family transcriptional regulator n=1 Tax=Limobrevibacterium gyesilva TaxID=2991712 RepID=A0AA41YK53_9PROT|nr:GntR family transcriptional regulator [Limobrevibacterium gyesilva]MCW3474744.1 GntR family transcriptional regulator [Limobrevibacterium gyesilva]